MEIGASQRLSCRSPGAWVNAPGGGLAHVAFHVLALEQLLLRHKAIVGGAALLAVSVMYFMRKPHEEGLMLGAFGDDYRADMARTGGVLPRLFPCRPS